MSLFDWFANREKSEAHIQQQQEREIADGLWTKCEKCGVLAYTKDLLTNQLVCPECNHHMHVKSDERIRQIIDNKTWKALGENLYPTDSSQISRSQSLLRSPTRYSRKKRV